MDKQQIVTMIQELSDAYGAPGFEDEVVAVGRKYGEPLTSHMEEDSIRNLYLYRKENKGNRPVILLDAHSDEVGFVVQAIRPNGTIEFLPLGGWVANTVPAHKVKIRNSEGQYVSGVVASKPPHYMTAAEKGGNLTIDQMVIDVGAVSREEVMQDFKIQVGAPVVPDVKFEYNEMNGVMLGKAFDCRMGCAAVLETMKTLAGKELNLDVIGTLTSQEEIGERGAMVAANRAKPDIAIVFEGAPADDTFEPEYKIQTGLHKGPMLRHFDRSMVTNPRFIRYAIDLGHQLGIPVQEAVRSGGGTNGGIYHTSRGGVPTIVLSVPVRYTHSHHCYSAMDDFEAAVKLAAAIVESLTAEQVRSF